MAGKKYRRAEGQGHLALVPQLQQLADVGLRRERHGHERRKVQRVSGQAVEQQLPQFLTPQAASSSVVVSSDRRKPTIICIDAVRESRSLPTKVMDAISCPQLL